MLVCCVPSYVLLPSFSPSDAFRVCEQALESDALALAVPRSTRTLSIAMLQQLSVQAPAPAAATLASREAGMGFLLEVAGKRGRKGQRAAAAH